MLAGGWTQRVSRQCNLVGLAERGRRRGRARAALEVALLVRRRPWPTTSPGRRPRLDRSSERAICAPPAAGGAPALGAASETDTCPVHLVRAGRRSCAETVGRACALRVELAVVAHVQACMPLLLSAPPSLVRRSPHEHAWFSKLGARLLRGSRATRAPKASQERTAYRRTASGAILALTPTLPQPVHTARDPFPNLPFRHVHARGRPSPRDGGRRRAALPSRRGPRAPLSACAAVACGGLSGPTTCFNHRRQL